MKETILEYSKTILGWIVLLLLVFGIAYACDSRNDNRVSHIEREKEIASYHYEDTIKQLRSEIKSLKDDIDDLKKDFLGNSLYIDEKNILHKSTKCVSFILTEGTHGIKIIEITSLSGDEFFCSDCFNEKEISDISNTKNRPLQKTKTQLFGD